MTIRAVFFDLDETLIDARSCHLEANRLTFEDFGLDYARARAIAGDFVGMRLVDSLAARRDALGVREADLPVQRLMERREAHYLRLLPETGTLLSGAKEAVLDVRQRGLIPAVVSSSTLRVIREVFNLFGLANVPAFVVAGDEVARGKPHPESYELAFDRLAAVGDVGKHEVLVVEDSASGVRAGQSAGLPVCLVPYDPPSADVNPEYRLSSLVELPELLERLRSE